MWRYLSHFSLIKHGCGFGSPFRRAATQSPNYGHMPEMFQKNLLLLMEADYLLYLEDYRKDKGLSLLSKESGTKSKVLELIFIGLAKDAANLILRDDKTWRRYDRKEPDFVPFAERTDFIYFGVVSSYEGRLLVAGYDK